MANITSFPLSVVIVGDGASLTAAVNVSPTPTAVTLTQVQDSLGHDVSSNVSSVTLTGSTVNFNFNAGFSGSISVVLALAYPSVNNIQQQPVVQVTSPWVVSLASTTITGSVAVTAPTLTKGTQGANGFSVQDLRDAGRNSRAFMLDAITAAPSTEALVSVVQWYSNAAVAGTTQPAVVPAGKTLRLTSWKIMYQSLTTPGYAVVRMRVNTAGVAVLASPLVWSFEAGSGTAGNTTNALAGAVMTETGEFPEGFEIPAASGIGFSMAGYSATGVLALQGGVRFAVFGYEY
jgi:hypothetical protein